MTIELSYRLILAGLLLSLVSIRVTFDHKVQPLRLATRDESGRARLVEREGQVSFMLRVPLFLILAGALLLYIIYPASLTRLALPFPNWWRWLGIGLGFGCLPLLVWIHLALGRYWSPGLEIKPCHRLVTSGPYRHIRHPMYAVSILFLVAVSLVSANGLVIGPGLAMVILIYDRIIKEEKLMVAYFGDRYRAYLRTTGRLLPRIPWPHRPPYDDRSART